jgi:hypothetical protein
MRNTEIENADTDRLEIALIDNLHDRRTKIEILVELGHRYAKEGSDTVCFPTKEASARSQRIRNLSN